MGGGGCCAVIVQLPPVVLYVRAYCLLQSLWQILFCQALLLRIMPLI